MSNSDEKINDLKENKGIFGFGFSHNNNLDLLNLVILAYAGIIIQFFFSSNYDENGLNGPATLALWGYGLTGIAIFLMIFISIYINNKKNNKDQHTFENKEGIFDAIKSIILTDSLPIVLTLGIIFYIFFINYTYFERINKGFLPDTYNTYYLFSSILLISQIGLIVKYLYNELDSLVFGNNPTKDKETTLIKSLSYILITLNFVFILIMHILLGFFSTNG
tara:strand:- start:3 stop:665 length:663 start_codon:yes stop_codon:yes gene_type:complete